MSNIDKKYRICSICHKKALCTITKPENKKLKNTIIIFFFFVVIFLLFQVDAAQW